MIQYGAVPVFVDVTIPQYNIDVTQLEAALSDKTKAVMIAHTLGNPFDLARGKGILRYSIICGLLRITVTRWVRSIRSTV